MFVPEAEIDLRAEAERLGKILDEVGNVNIFLSEGAGVEAIVAELEAAGQVVDRDAFGHIRLDKINPGNWFSKQFSKMLNTDRVLVQKSGYYSRSAKSNEYDLELIESMANLAVDCALAGTPGVIGHDEERDDELRAIEFERIAGGKPFDIPLPWFGEMLAEIGQPPARPAHG